MAGINTTETTTETTFNTETNTPCVSGVKVGDLVTFGRPNGQKTEGRVIRVNPVSITVEQTEARGVVKVREAGTKWRLHPSLVQLVGEEKPLVPVTTGVKVKPPIAFKNKKRTTTVDAGDFQTTPSRPEAEIILDIRDVEVGLSPECLSHDGERSRKEVKAAAKRLNAKRVALVKELGREPSYQEIWGVPEFGSSESTEPGESAHD